MKCRNARKWLPQLHRGELSDEVAGLVRDHLMQCAACRGLAAEYRALGNLTKNLPPVQEPPGFYDGFLSEIMARARESEASSPGLRLRLPAWLAWRSPRRALTGIMAAAMLLAVVSGWYIFGPSHQPMRNLESYLRSGNLQALEHAMQDDEHRARLLNDSVSVDLLIDALARLQKTQARHGLAGDQLLHIVKLLQADTAPSENGGALRKNLAALVRRGSFNFRRALSELRTVRRRRGRVTVAEITGFGSPANRS